jgi:two-component system nitrogen regulation response regulator GlnG
MQTASDLAEVGRAPKPKLLVADDDPVNRRLLTKVFEAEGFAVLLAEDGQTALQQLGADSPTAALLDLRMPGLDGLATLREMKKLAPALPVIILTSDGDVSAAVEAIRLGAYDFLTRPIQSAELVLRVRHALENRHLLEEVDDLRKRLVQSGPLPILGVASKSMQKLVEQIRQVAPSTFTVLIQGETGTGKELVARSVHEESPRGERPFVAVDCGAIPDNLLESELFGYEKGAFTGADRRKIGFLRLAEGGSLFLDEVGNLSLPMQAKFLRVLQERRVRPLGAARDEPVDVRIIAATNESLQSQVAAGRFRQDLYFRLAEFTLTVPPLRSRPEDVLPLARRFQDEAAAELRRRVRTISEEAGALLMAHAWPGNVRELRNVIRQSVLVATGSSVEADDVRPLLTLPATLVTASIPVCVGVPLKQVVEAAVGQAEKQAIAEALRATHGNKSQAARLLQIDYKTLHVKVKRYGLGSG